MFTGVWYQMGCNVAVGWIVTFDSNLKIFYKYFVTTQPAAVPVTGKLKYTYILILFWNNIMHKDMINYFLNV